MIDSRTAPYAATLLRVSLGAMFIAHSLILKYFTFTLPGTAQFLTVRLETGFVPPKLRLVALL